MDDRQIEKICTEVLEKEFRKGGFTKMMSKRMRAKVDGKVILHHSLKHQTAVFTEISASNRKRVGYTYTIVNYFETPRGYVYVLRHGIPYPTLFMFTGHFFDRLLLRGYNNKDHHARMQAVFRLLRHMDRKSLDDGMSLLSCPETGSAYLAALGGLCLGDCSAYKALPPELDFVGENIRTSNPALLLPPEHRMIFFFLTYVDEANLRPELLHLYKHLSQKPDKT